MPDGAPFERSSLFARLEVQPPDVLLSLIKLFKSDPRSAKLDLGVGVYRDALGATPVFAAVKAAEAQLLASQDTKAYLGPEGNLAFIAEVRRLVFGDQPEAAAWLGVQAPGGTGALRLAAQLAATARPGGTIWLGVPSWPNHAQIFGAAGLVTRTFRAFDEKAQRLDMESMLHALGSATAGDLVLLQGCGHNPTGADPDPEQWRAIAAVLARRGAIPLVDLAYHGLAEGLEADLAGLRCLAQAVDEALVAYSCDKNFGLYRERTGALFVRASVNVEAIHSTILKIGREAWSMPPDHGAAIVAEILRSPKLSLDWRTELAAMRERLRVLRRTLAAASPALAGVAGQRGLFAQLPLCAAQVGMLRRDDGIYMAAGRINIAGLQIADVARFARALDRVMA